MVEELRLSATAALAAGTGASAAVDKLAKSFLPKKARREKGPAGKQTKLKVAEWMLDWLMPTEGSFWNVNWMP